MPSELVQLLTKYPVYGMSRKYCRRHFGPVMGKSSPSIPFEDVNLFQSLVKCHILTWSLASKFRLLEKMGQYVRFEAYSNGYFLIHSLCPTFNCNLGISGIILRQERETLAIYRYQCLPPQMREGKYSFGIWKWRATTSSITALFP